MTDRDLPTRLFIKVHNALPDHPKTAELSDKAFRHLIELWCYCSRNLTDGIVSNGQAKRITTKKSLGELITAGFVIAHENHIEMHGYLDIQQSAQQVADLRERRSKAGAKGGKARATSQASAKASAKQMASKIQPDTDTDTDTTSTDVEVESVGVAAKPTRRATQRPEGFAPNDKHQHLAAQLGVDLAAELAAFVDHHDARGSTFKNWDSALNTWLRNAAKFAARSRATATPTTRMDEHRALVLKLQAEERAHTHPQIGAS